MTLMTIATACAAGILLSPGLMVITARSVCEDPADPICVTSSGAGGSTCQATFSVTTNPVVTTLNYSFRMQAGGTLDPGKCKCVTVDGDDPPGTLYCVYDSTDKCNFNGTLEVDTVKTDQNAPYPWTLFGWGVGGSYSRLDTTHTWVNAGQFGAQEDINCGGTGTTIFTIVVRSGILHLFSADPDPNGAIYTTMTIKAYCTPCKTDPHACDTPPE